VTETCPKAATGPWGPCHGMVRVTHNRGGVMVRVRSRAIAVVLTVGGALWRSSWPCAVSMAWCGGGEGEARRKWAEDGWGAVHTGEVEVVAMLGFNTGEEEALQ
jgi:hypothetical protein